MTDIKKDLKKETKSHIKESNTKHFWIWVIFFLALFVISVVAGVLLRYILKGSFPETAFWYGFFLGISIFLFVSYLTIKNAWSQVPQNHIWNIEVFGKAVAQEDPGLCLLFPWFGLVSVFEVYMGEQQMRLFMDEIKEASEHLEFKGLGDVEFKDGSAPVFATVYFTVVDAKKSAYNIENIYVAIEEKMDSALRSFLGQYTIDEINVLKSRVCLVNIMNGDYINPTKEEVEKSQLFSSQGDQEKKLRKTMLWRSILDVWGTKINHIAISDVNLPKNIIEARESIIKAQKEAEAAIHQSKTRITLADAERKALEKEGLGYAAQVKLLVAKGMSANDAAAYLSDRLKWKNVGEKGATVIVDSGNGGLAGLGMQFAAGMRAMQGPTIEANISKNEKPQKSIKK